MMLFNYVKSDEEMFNTIVDGAIESTRLAMEGNVNRKEYEDL